MMRFFNPFKGKQEQIARDFFNRIIEMEYDQCLITLRSSLWDFGLEGSDEEIKLKIREIYNVDISGIPDGNLALIFRMIEKKGKFR